jgi:peptidoglycan/LPS O-acetylase OafA/YrhL
MNNGRLDFLDSLRGIAAVSVVFFHTLLVPAPNPALSNHFASSLVHFAGTGVFLFFVISGWSLAMTMPRHDRTASPPISFAISRLFRIAPLFYAVMAVTMARDFLKLGTIVDPATLLANAAFVFNFVPGGQEGIVAASWTIGVEMIFYALFIPIYRAGLAAQIGMAVVSTGLFAGIVSLTDRSYYYWSVVGYFPMFLIGMWTYRLYAWAVAAGTITRRTAWAVLIAGLAVLGACAAVPGAEKMILLRIPIAIGYATVLLACGLLRPAILSSPRLIFFGTISYSLYLIHVIVILLVDAAFPRLAGVLPGDLAYWADALLVLVVATPIAAVLHKMIERPSDTLGRALIRAWLQPPAPKAA